MLAMLPAVIGLLGTIVGSTVVSQWLTGRDLRESIKRDLDLHDRLPEGMARSNLMGDIERRVQSLTNTEARSFPTWHVSVTAALVIYALYWAVYAINGGYKYGRDHDGVLRIHFREVGTQSFQLFMLLLLLGLIFVTVSGHFATKWLIKTLGRQHRVPTFIATPTDQNSPPPPSLSASVSQPRESTGVGAESTTFNRQMR